MLKKLLIRWLQPSELRHRRPAALRSLRRRCSGHLPIVKFIFVLLVVQSTLIAIALINPKQEPPLTTSDVILYGGLPANDGRIGSTAKTATQLAKEPLVVRTSSTTSITNTSLSFSGGVGTAVANGYRDSRRLQSSRFHNLHRRGHGANATAIRAPLKRVGPVFLKFAKIDRRLRIVKSPVLLIPARKMVPAAVKRIDKNFFETKRRQREYYRRRPTMVNPFRHRIRLAPKDICSNDNVSMIIVVHTHPAFVEQRNVIRTTWASAIRIGRWPVRTRVSESTCCEKIRLVFVVGMDRNSSAVNAAIDGEFLVHRDIVQGDFIDDYHNMTLKSLLDLKFVDEYCPKVSYVLKSDDDMIINLPYLLDYLNKQPIKESMFVGPLNGRSKVMRTESKWKLSTEEFPFDIFPPYMSGSAYVISGDLVHKLFDTAQYVPPIFIDDVYVTGILGRIVGAQHILHRGFAYWATPVPSACALVNGVKITGTKMKLTSLVNMWNELKNTTLDCQPVKKVQRL